MILCDGVHHIKGENSQNVYQEGLSQMNSGPSLPEML